MVNAAPGPNDDDTYGHTVYQKSHIVIKDDVRIRVQGSGAIVDDSNTRTTVFSSDVARIVKLTQAAYDALSPPDSATLYVIVG